MGATLTSDRLVIRPWALEDADAALAIYGQEDVSRWLSPAMERVPDVAAMRVLLQQWIAEAERAVPPAGRWALERREDGQVVGGVILLPLPPGDVDYEIGWHLAPEVWGQGYASEAGHAVAHWAFRRHDVDELFAVVRPRNTRGAAVARRIGMEWVGETGKYYDLHLQVYRVRAADLDRPFLQGEEARPR
jgi:RimJ/RimL family protein N-acetyltransferase